MSSTGGPPNSTVPTLAYDRDHVENLVGNGEVSTMEKHIEDGNGNLRPDDDQKEHHEHSLKTPPQLPGSAQETQDAHGDGYGGSIGESQVGDLGFDRKAQKLSLSASPTFFDPGTQDAPASSKPAKNDTIQSSQIVSHDDPVATTSGSTVSIARVPFNQSTSLLLPANAEEHYKTPDSSSRTSIDGESDSKDAETAEGQADGSSTSEIQSIMDQFGEGGDGPDEEEVMSPRLELAGGFLGSSIQHPPRKSSLEPINAASPTVEQTPSEETVFLHASTGASPQTLENSSPGSSVKSYSLQSSSLPQSARYATEDGHEIPSSASLHKPLPPEPDSEPDLPFDFHRFLEQLRHRAADPVAKFLRSFLVEFGKKPWMVHEQVKIISDFLAFIANKMAQCEVWRGVSDAEFDNAKEGMEKLVMNRLYSQTFSPAIPPPTPLLGSKGKRKNLEKLLGPRRKGQHQEDIERDEILEQKVRIYGWVQEEHLDIAPVGDSGRRFLVLAQQELLKIKAYRAPRDKVICVLNCCKVIFGLLRNSKSADTSADSFVPLLIYVVLRANPDHLVSNVQYILRFRNQDKLGGEAGYYLSSLMGAIQFIENLDRTTLTISDEDFEKNVESAVSAIAERHKEDVPQSPRHPRVSDKSALSEPEVVPQSSVDVEYAPPRRSTSSRGVTDNSVGSDGTDDDTAVGGLLRTIQRPLSSLGRMFSEERPTTQHPDATSPFPPEPQPSPPRLSPAVFQPPRDSNETRRSHEGSRESEAGRRQTGRLSPGEAARQVSAETAGAQRLLRVEHNNVVETLTGMFPDLDKDIIDDVVREKQGRVGLAVDACLALSA